MMSNTHPYFGVFCPFFFFHSPVLFHQKWTEMIDTGYRDPWGERWDFPRPSLQNRKTGNCFPTCRCGFTDTVTGLILFFSHLLHIYCGNCEGKSVFCVEYVCSHWATGRDAVGFAGSGHYSFLALLCCDLQLWFAEACSVISLSQSRYLPRWTTVILSPLTLRRSQARALAEYLPLEACSPPLAGSACHCVVHGAVWAALLPFKSLCWDATDLCLCFLCISGSQSQVNLWTLRTLKRESMKSERGWKERSAKMIQSQ